MTDERETHLRDTLQRFLDATVRQDAALLDTMTAEGYTFTHATTAICDTREEWLASFRSGARRYKLWDVSDLNVRLFPACAVITGRGHQTVVRPTGDFELYTAFANTWVEREGRWQCAVWQATLVP